MPKGDRDILKADIEDGHTPIANLLLEAIAIANLTGKEKGVLLLVCRRTYGWHHNGERHKETALSIRDCANALGIDPRTAQKILKKLTEDNILLSEFSRPGYGYTYQVNTRVGGWNNSRVNHQLLKKLSGDGLIKNSTVGTAKTPTPTETNLTSPKESLNKIKRSNLYINKHKGNSKTTRQRPRSDPLTDIQDRNKTTQKRPADDPDKYIKGKYGHMVQR